MNEKPLFPLALALLLFCPLLARAAAPTYPGTVPYQQLKTNQFNLLSYPLVQLRLNTFQFDGSGDTITITNLGANNVFVTNITSVLNVTSNLYVTNLWVTNFYGGNTYTTNLWVTNLYATFATNYFSTNLYLTNLWVTNLYATNIYGGDTYTTNLYVTNFYAGNTYNTNIVTINTNVYFTNTYVFINGTNVATVNPTDLYVPARLNSTNFIDTSLHLNAPDSKDMTLDGGLEVQELTIQDLSPGPAILIDTGDGFVTLTNSASVFANPTASVGLTAVNGTSTNWMRADAAPALGTVGTAGTYGDSTHFPVVTTDAAGRVTTVTTNAIPHQTKSLKFNFPRLVDNAGCTYPNTNDFTLATFMVATFSGTGASNANYCRFAVRVPSDIDTAVDLTAALTFELTGADTGAHTYHLGMVSIANSAAIAGTPANFVALDFAGDASGASGDVESIAATTLTGWKSAVTAGQWWLIELRRDGANDASTVASRLQELEIFYTANQ